ncbi:hypothetical protein [Deinococcus yavapaiensis]|uniref:Uncharacterized protein n=1 Tax=Deinococcus yavapaiensis KR-236 TaxID=694435 RepID=A0A318SBJ0_9DEIO|nr:hypothetical protein [Deinococcus yavapaiensis]PYE55724.1 hypothetical protein DES52_10287 [Deinococcus yavapaiensis KR-236]
MKRAALLLVLVPLAACAPRPTAAPKTFETYVLEGEGRGTFTSAKYRVVLNVDKTANVAAGVFENVSAGDNYRVTGQFIPTKAGGELDLTLSQSANANVGVDAGLGASLLGRALGASAGASANAAFGRSAQLTGSLVNESFSGKLRTVTANYSVSLKRVE